MFGETDPTHHTYPSPIQKALARTLYQALIFLFLSPLGKHEQKPIKRIKPPRRSLAHLHTGMPRSKLNARKRCSTFYINKVLLYIRHKLARMYHYARKRKQKLSTDT